MDDKLVDQKHLPLSRGLRIFIFCNFIALSIVMSGDNGVLSSSKKIIIQDLELNEKLYAEYTKCTKNSIGNLKSRVSKKYKLRLKIHLTSFFIITSMT